MDKKPLIQKIESLEVEVAELKKIILDFVMEYKNQKIFTHNEQDKFIMLERENLKKKKGWLWDY